ncbi:MAG TPA: ribosome biogenesis GTPase Der, partial [Hyphomicrobiaceae bacterium]|nr:ribosome biogenesis GTPase Der [Hyphomicrobiaceae bacterium]
VTNKAEGRAAEAGILDAFRLGLGEPVPISAEHGEGLGDLESTILKRLGLTPKPNRKGRRRRARDEADLPLEDADDEATAPTDDAPSRAVRVAIIGRPNAGKSTLVNALLGEDRMITGPEPGLTRDSVATDTEWNGRPVKLWDTAGLRRKARIDEKAEKLSASDAIRAIKYADVAVILVDAERPLEQQDLVIAGRAIDEGRAVVVAVNKWDLVADKQKALRDIRESVAEQLAQVQGVEIVTLSARSGRGLDKLKSAVLRAYDIWNTRIPTHKLNQWLEAALSRHAPPLASGRRIKIRYITQVSARPPTFVAFSAKAARLPDSYVKYLVNGLRDTFDLPGTPVRFNLRKPDNPFDEE